MQTLDIRLLLLLSIPVAGLIAMPVLANENDDDPVTMQAMEESDDPDEIFEQIELPEVASEVAVEASEHGLATANAAREDGREFGQSRAEEARERAGDAGEAGESALDEARDGIAGDMARGDFDNLPEQARENIPEEVQDRIRDLRDERGGPPDGVGGPPDGVGGPPDGVGGPPDDVGGPPDNPGGGG